MFLLRDKDILFLGERDLGNYLGFYCDIGKDVGKDLGKELGKELGLGKDLENFVRKRFRKLTEACIRTLFQTHANVILSCLNEQPNKQTLG